MQPISLIDVVKQNQIAGNCPDTCKAGQIAFMINSFSSFLNVKVARD